MRHISGLNLRGISACIPKTRIENRALFPEDQHQKLINSVGVDARRVAQSELTSDLCTSAAKNLLKQIGWGPEEIDIAVFVTQTPDYQIPSTSPIIAKSLGLRRNIISFDVNQGCSGFVQGLDVLYGLMAAYGLQKGLLLAGDTSSKLIGTNDVPGTVLFGDGGTATAVERNASAASTYFESWVDGSGSSDIMIKNYGVSGRSKCSGHKDVGDFLALNGPNVFSFAISRVPEVTKSFLSEINEKKSGDIYSADRLLVLHQANKMINSTVEKKLGFSSDKVARSIHEFGNTSSSSIPLSLCLEAEKSKAAKEWLAVGFGVGLNVNAALIPVNTPYLGIVEYDGI